MRKHKISDEELAAFTLKDKERFNELVHRYANKIRSYIARIIGGWQEAEDLTQEVFFKAYRHIASFNPNMKFSSWLYRIAHNESVNYIKKHYRYKTVEFDEGIKNKFTDDESILEKIDNQIDSQIIKMGLVELDPRSREILELSFYEEKSYLEIADILEISVNSVGPTIMRAKERLKRIIEEKNEFRRKN